MAPAPPARAPKALMDEIIEEIILRLPPAEPANLVRAALVCKPWCGLIASPRFRRRFRAFHGTPPTLGLLCNIREGRDPCVVRFVPTCPVRPPPRAADQRASFTCDARHGRVLLSGRAAGREEDPLLLVWNPMTNERWQLPPGPSLLYRWSVAVLCAAMGACAHLDCPRGAFVVVALTTITLSRKVALWVYSSEAGAWRKQAYVLADGVSEFSADFGPSALVGNGVYFSVNLSKLIVSYDLESRKTSVIHGPPLSDGHCDDDVVMSRLMEGRVLGVVRLDEDARLSILSMEVNGNGEKGWTQIRVIELVKLLSINARSIIHDYVGFSYDFGSIFMVTDDGLFTVDLKSGLKNKVCEGLRNNGRLDVFPYTTFYTPALGPPAASAGEGPSMDASSASKA